nr:MAG TPA: hypothetical protein [Caudoviricetes sp.]
MGSDSMSMGVDLSVWFDLVTTVYRPLGAVSS